MTDSGTGDDVVLHGRGDDGDDGPAPPDTGTPSRRRPRLVAAVVAVTLAAFAVGGVATIRALEVIPLPPPPALTPEPGLLDAGGLDDVRLGQDFSEFLATGCDDDCRERRQSQLLRDSDQDCTQYPVDAPAPGVGSWAWVRAGEVAGVGLTLAARGAAPDGAAAPPVGVRTWPGLPLGAVLSPRPDELDRWDEDVSAPVPVYRREHGGVVTTVADTTGDGRLDYATVATVAGEQCHPDPDLWDVLPPDDVIEATEPIVDRSLAGVTVGMTADAALRSAAWWEPDRGHQPDRREGCRTLWTHEGWGVAYIDDGIVVGVEALAVRDGPAAGMDLDEAGAFLDPTTRGRNLPWEEDPPSTGALPAGWGIVWGTDDAGREIALTVARGAGRVAGLDVPVTAEAALPSPTVVGVLVGQNCTEWPGPSS